MPPVDINLWAVLVAAVASMIIGALWYSPPVFGKIWMKLVAKSEKDLKKGASQGYIVATGASLVTAYVLAHFVDFVRANTIGEGLTAGFWIWLGFVATTLAVEYVFEGRPQKLFLINAGHILIVLLVMGAILAVWV